MSTRRIEKIVTPIPEKDLLKKFVEEYDYLFWINRVAILHRAIEDSEFRLKIVEQVQLRLDRENLPIPDESILDRIKLEMHFTAYHSTEALLGLIFAFVYQPELPWLWLTTYSFSEFNEMVAGLAEKGFSMFHSDEKLVAKALFFNVADEELADLVENSANFTIDYVRRLAKEFQDKQDFNSYKHGLRTMRAKPSSPKLRSLDGKELLRWNELTTTYLEVGKRVEKNGQVFRDLRIVNKAIDHEKSVRIIVTNTHLMRNLFEIRKAQLLGRSEIEVKLFDKEHNAFDVLRRTKLGMSYDKFTISPR